MNGAKMSLHNLCLAASVVPLCLTGYAHSKVTGGPYSWSLPQSGYWDDESNWDGPPGYPGSSEETVFISVPGPYTVSVRSDTETGSLYIENFETDLRVLERVEYKVLYNFVNEGTITVNPLGLPNLSTLRVGQSLVVGGSGDIRLNAVTDHNDARIQTLGGVVTLGPGISIFGSGSIWGNYFNQGLITSSNPGGIGLMINKTISQDSSGGVVMDGNQMTVLEGAGILGGSLQLLNGGSLLIEGSGTVDVDNLHFGDNSRVTFRGTSEYPFGNVVPDQIEILADNSKLLLRNDLHNDGAISLRSDMGHFDSTLSIEESCAIDGEGEISLVGRTGSSSSSAVLTVQEGASLIIGPDQLIHGAGTIETQFDLSQVINNGTVHADVQGSSIILTGTIYGGLYQAGDGDLLIGRYSTVYDGEFMATGSGQVGVTGDPARLHNPTLHCDVVLSGTSPELTLSGVVTNNGRLVLDVQNTFYEPEVIFEHGADLFGTGAIEMKRSVFENSLPILRGGFSLHEPHEIRGSGAISANIQSTSTIRADDPNFPLTLNGTYTGGSYIAENSATMVLRGAHDGGVYMADNGRFTLYNAELSGAQFQLTGNGHVRLLPDGNLSLENMRLDANLDLCINSQVSMNENVELNGSHLVLDDGVLILRDYSVTGTGSITLRKQIAGSPGIRVNHGICGFGEGYVIGGSGYILGPSEGMFVNSNVILANDPNESLSLFGNIGGSGEFVAMNSDLILKDGMHLMGGKISSEGGNSIVLEPGTVTMGNVTNDTLITIPSGQHSLMLEGDLINNDRILVDWTPENGGGLIGGEGDIDINGTGVIELVESSHTVRSRIRGSGGVLTVNQGQTVQGSGSILGAVALKGILEPGGMSRTIYTDRLRLSSESNVVLDIDGTGVGQFDRFQVSVFGGMEIDGELELRFGEFTPIFGDSWRIIDRGGNTGHFHTVITDHELPLGQVYLMLLSNEGLDVIVTCQGDINGDLSVDFIDVIQFIANFKAGFESTDLNGDGHFNFMDVSIFVGWITGPCS